MTNDLVKRAREWDFCWPSRDVEMLVPAMADRIEELEAKLEALDHAYDSIVQAFRFEALRTDDAESKLAKAVETISLCRKMQAQFAHTEDPLMVLLDTTIAELKGQEDE